MKARCKCGKIFNVTPELEGKKARCPGCGRVIRLPSRAPSEGSEPSGAPEPSPEPSGEESPGDDMDFDWGDLELEGSESERGGAEKETPKTRAPAGEPAGGPTDEFSLDSGAEPEGTGVAGPEMPSGAIIVCPDCGKVVEAGKEVCPDCGAALGQEEPAATGAGGAGEETGPAWAGSYWGAFLFAYAAVFAANGWKSYGKYVMAGVGIPILIVVLMYIPFIGCITGCIGFLAVPIILAGAVIGGMYYYMAHSADKGLAPIFAARPQVMSDMVVPFFQVISSSNLLVVGPIIAGVLLAKVTGTADIAQMAEKLQSAQGAERVATLGSVIASSTLILGGLGLGIYCFPMQLMLLGASQSLGKTFNPVNMVKAIGKAPLQYTGISLFFAFNVILTPILLIMASFATAIFQTIPFGGLISLVVIVSICIYTASVVGWRMGYFLYRNSDVFDHVR